MSYLIAWMTARFWGADLDLVLDYIHDPEPYHVDAGHDIP